jgi:hypothetical protein
MKSFFNDYFLICVLLGPLNVLQNIVKDLGEILFEIAGK